MKKFVKVVGIKPEFSYLTNHCGMRVGYVYEFEGDALGGTFTSTKGNWELMVGPTELAAIAVEDAPPPAPKLDSYLMDKWWDMVIAGEPPSTATQNVKAFKGLRHGDLFIK